MGTVPSGGDYEYDLAHDVPAPSRPVPEQQSPHECAPPVRGETDLGTDFTYDEAHGG